MLENIIQLCKDIRAGNADDIPFDFMGQRAYIAKEANDQYERTDPNDAVVQNTYFIVRGKYNCQQTVLIQKPSIVFKN